MTFYFCPFQFIIQALVLKIDFNMLGVLQVAYKKVEKLFNYFEFNIPAKQYSSIFCLICSDICCSTACYIFCFAYLLLKADSLTSFSKYYLVTDRISFIELFLCWEMLLQIYYSISQMWGFFLSNSRKVSLESSCWCE